MMQDVILNQSGNGYSPAVKIALIPLLLPVLIAASPVQAALDGKLESANCDAVKGWAWDSASPATHVQVDIYDVTPSKTTLLSTVTAQLFRKGLLNAGIGDGKYGFAFAMPASIRDAETHNLSVRFKGSATELSGSPKTTSACYGKLNDTGWQTCGTDSSDGLACPLTDYPRQDGDYGRDALARNGKLVKNGKGGAGFDYSKIANDGSVLPAGTQLGGKAKDWACTRDNLTGLVWEVKTTNGGLRDMTNSYSWYNPDTSTNDGFSGYQDNGLCTGGIACDTYSYVNAVNAKKLCGKTDWRMPSIEEMIGIVDYSSNGYSFNADYLPNIRNAWYATNTTGPRSYDNKVAWWGLYTAGGYIVDDFGQDRTKGYGVILVSGKQ